MKPRTRANLCHIGLALMTLSAANLLLLLTCLYWWVFTGDLPPFIQGTFTQGRSLGGVMITLSMVTVVAGIVGGLIWDENR